MSVVTIQDRGCVEKDANEALIFLFDWDTQNLAPAVTIASQSVLITSWSVIGDTALTADTATGGLGIQAGSRTVKVKLSAGTPGVKYQVTNRIVTNETPAETKEKSFFLLLQDT